MTGSSIYSKHHTCKMTGTDIPSLYLTSDVIITGGLFGAKEQHVNILHGGVMWLTTIMR